MGHIYEYVIFIFVLGLFQYQPPSSHGDFGPCGLFIPCSLEKIFVEIHIIIRDWILDQVVVPVGVGITLLGVLITIFYLVVIQGLICFLIISFSWQGDLTNISFIEEFYFILLRLYHISFLIKKFVLFFFICTGVWILKRQVWGEEYCFNMIDVFNLFRCKTPSWEIWECPIQS